jgi:CPA1 family monovalent cation:H+ antiporter
MFTVILVVAGVAAIALANALSKRIGVAAPLLLVAVGVIVSMLPWTPEIEVEPEWILAGILPPLLYSSAVRMPAMDFRRDFKAISAFSILLVIITSAVTGWVVSAMIPGIGLATGIAVGAIISPTDAAATGIVKRVGVPHRVVTVLDGESLLNDASALVVLRTAIAATAASVSFWGVIGDFVWAVGIAAGVGAIVGVLALRISAHVKDPALYTVFSFLIPFAAYLPVERFEASGLVAVVVAGIITGQGGPKFISARNRIAQEQNWRTIDLLLEGSVFLAMGLQMDWLLGELRREHGSLPHAALVGIVALAVVLALRAVFTVVTLWYLHGAAKNNAAKVAQIDKLGNAIYQGLPPRTQGRQPPRRSDAPDPADPRGMARLRDRERRIRARLRLFKADTDYLVSQPLGPKEGTILVWAGTRGVVTLAAAQTLPFDTPHRATLVLVAFTVAMVSLIGQGLTLPWGVRLLGLHGEDPATDDAERDRLHAQLAASAQSFLDAPGLTMADGAPYPEDVVDVAKQAAPWAVVPNVDEPPDPAHPATPEAVEAEKQRREEFRQLRLTMVQAMRAELLSARASGTYPSPVLAAALEELDAEEISIELRDGGD